MAGSAQEPDTEGDEPDGEADGAGEIGDGGRPRDAADERALIAGVAGWSIVHGLAQLWMTGNLPAELGDDPEAITRRVARLLGPRPA